MKSAWAAFGGVAAMLALAPAQAQTFDACADLARNSDRVACFEALWGDEASAEAGGKWLVRQEPSEFTDDTNVYLSLESHDASVCGRNRDDKVVLWIRCRENTTSLLFQTGCHMTSSSLHDYGDVAYSLDGGPERTVSMTKWRDNYSLGLWYGADAIPLIRELLDVGTMRVRMKPFDEDIFTVAFDIAGLDEAIAPLREACRW